MKNEKEQTLRRIPFYEENSFSVFDLIVILSEQVFLLIGAIIFCVVSTVFYVTFIAEEVYTADAKIISFSGKSNRSQFSGLASQFGIELSANQNQLKWNFKDILSSRKLAKNIIKKKFTTSKFGVEKPLFQILTYGNNNPPLDLSLSEGKAVNKLMKMVSVQEDLKSGIFSVQVSSGEPILSFDLINAFIEELDAYQKAFNKEITSQTRQFIEDRIKDTKKELEIAEEELKNFTKSNRRIENSPLLLLEKERLEREANVLSGVFTTLKQQLETAKIDEVKDSDYVIVFEDPEVPLYRSSPAKKKAVFTSIIFGLLLGIALSILNNFKNKNKEFKKLLESKNILSDHFKSLTSKNFKK